MFLSNKTVTNTQVQLNELTFYPNEIIVEKLYSGRTHDAGLIKYNDSRCLVLFESIVGEKFSTGIFWAIRSSDYYLLSDIEQDFEKTEEGLLLKSIFSEEMKVVDLTPLLSKSGVTTFPNRKSS